MLRPLRCLQWCHEPPFNVEQHPFVDGMVPQRFHDQPMVKIVEERGQIEVKHPLAPFLDVALRLDYCVVRTLSWSGAEAV